MADNNDIIAILALNEQLKSLRSKTDQISMIALNAMLMARKERQLHNGFTVVTSELRQFCSALNENTGKLSKYIFRIVMQLSEQRKHARYTRLIENTNRYASRTRHGRNVLAGMRQTHQLKSEALERNLDKTKYELLQELNRTIKRCEVGESLGVLAKVESQTGIRDNSLNLIATQISKTIEEIQNTLKDAARVIS